MIFQTTTKNICKKDSDRSKNFMTLANVEPFCKRFILDIGVYNSKARGYYPKTVGEK